MFSAGSEVLCVSFFIFKFNEQTNVSLGGMTTNAYKHKSRCVTMYVTGLDSHIGHFNKHSCVSRAKQLV